MTRLGFKIAVAGILAAAILFVIRESVFSPRYKSYEKKLSAAQKTGEDGDLSEAEKALKILCAEYPEEPAAFIELSYVYEEMGILDSALKQAETALKKANRALTRGSLFLNRVRLLQWRENLQQRIRELPLAIEGQDAIRIWSLGDEDGALSKLLELEKKYPEAYQPHAAMSVLYKSKGDNEKAVKEAEAGMTKIDLALKSKTIGRQMRALIEQDRQNLQDSINEILVLYGETG